MDNSRFKVHYYGSVFWLIFWTIFFFPIALGLFFTDCAFEIEGTTYYFDYDASRFWLGFWILVFFPVALLLLIINGFSIKSVSQK